MANTDPTAEMLTRIRNAVRASKKEVAMPSSRLKMEMLAVMKDKGYIADFKPLEEGNRKSVLVQLRYDDDNQCAIQDLQMVSKQSLRVYVGWRKLPRVLNGLGIAIVSTSQGLMTDEEARQKKIGGEVLCKVW